MYDGPALVTLERGDLFHSAERQKPMNAALERTEHALLEEAEPEDLPMIIRWLAVYDRPMFRRVAAFAIHLWIYERVGRLLHWPECQ